VAVVAEGIGRSAVQVGDLIATFVEETEQGIRTAIAGMPVVGMDFDDDEAGTAGG
jgi:hypothetical protein